MENIDTILLEYSQLAGKDDAKSESQSSSLLSYYAVQDISKRLGALQLA